MDKVILGDKVGVVEESIDQADARLLGLHYNSNFLTVRWLENGVGIERAVQVSKDTPGLILIHSTMSQRG